MALLIRSKFKLVEKLIFLFILVSTLFMLMPVFLVNNNMIQNIIHVDVAHTCGCGQTVCLR